MKVFRWIATGLVPALLACNTQVPTLGIATFNRPQRVTFACFDLGVGATRKLWPLAACDPSYAIRARLRARIRHFEPVLLDDAGMPQDAGTPALELPIVPTLHALVTQSDRGEVAAVDLLATSNAVIDSRPDIPGTTFVPAGELPGPIVVPPNHPELTYVANAGSHDISVLRTSAFRSLEVGENATVQRVRLRLDAAAPSAAPFDMVLSPDEDALFVTAPAAGLLLRLPLQRCDSVSEEEKPTCREGEIDAAHIVSVPLMASLSKAKVVAPPPGDEQEPYRLICQPSLVIPVPVARTIPVPMLPADAKPEPAGLAVDAFCRTGATDCKRRLLIADKRLPLIHSVDLDQLASGNAEAAVSQPILTGVPTTRLVVTPRVPVAIDSAEETQYVYAIDASDGSVLVVHDGRVVNVASGRGRRADRLDFGLPLGTGDAVAASLGILTPEFDVTGPAAQWVEAVGDKTAEINPKLCVDKLFPTRRPDRLRGVFLAVGLTDGTVHIVDVHDEELQICRDCDRTDIVARDDAGEPTDPMDAGMPDAGDGGEDKPKSDPYPVIRNRSRIYLAYLPDPMTASTPIRGPFVDPTFAVAGTVITVSNNGSTNDKRVAGLECVTCPATQSVSFPHAELATSDAGTDAAAGAGAGGNSQGGAEASGTTGSGAGQGGASGVAGSTDADTPAPAAGAGGSGAALDSRCATGQGRVCSMQDPWNEAISWYANYEGLIPGSRGGRGRFVEAGSGDNRTGELEFAGEARFCNVGVLGTDDIGDDRAGDQLQIIGPLPSKEEFDKAQGRSASDERARCETLVRGRDQEKTPIAFRIKQAFADRLVIDSELINRAQGLPADQANYALVQSCFLNMLVGYEVHVRESYALPVNDSYFLHRVVTDADTKRCKIDAAQSPKLTSRAYENALFDNGLISFKLKSGETTPAFGTALVLRSQDNTPKVVFDARSDVSGSGGGVTPVDLQFSPANQTFYVVDVTTRGLIPVNVNRVATGGLAPYQ